MTQKIVLFALAGLLMAFIHQADAQQSKVYRVGVIHQGGAYYLLIDGLRDGLRERGLREGKHFVLETRDTKGDLRAVEEAARNLERQKVDLIYAVTTSVTARVKLATATTPIVFCVGTDPVAAELVESFAKPGGRLTGVHFLATDLTAKRLEILKDLLPNLRRVVTFYDPSNPAARQFAPLAREAAQHFRIEFIERHVSSVKQLEAGLQGLRIGEVDAFLNASDAMVVSQAQLVIDIARAKRLATMFQERSLVAKGALASYGVNYDGIGRMSAKYVQRMFAGSHPKDLPVENFHKLELFINLNTAKQIGVTIPPEVLMEADNVIK